MHLLYKLDTAINQPLSSELNEVVKTHKQLQSLLRKISAKIHRQNDIEDIAFLINLAGSITSCFIGDQINQKKLNRLKSLINLAS